jgi:glutamate/tyrosine decarboxylase-like PLP-dependent enzyme
MTAPEWTREEIRRVGYRVVDLIAEHLAGLPSGPVFRPVPPAVAAAMLAESAPERGASPDAILDEVAAEVMPYPFGNGHPRFYGWVNSPPEVMGVFADALAAAMNPSCAGGNHAAIYVERQVLNWLKDMVGMPRAAMGLLVSGGSMAALTALAVARHRKAGFDVRAAGVQGAPARLVVYKGTEGHGCYTKAVELLGIGGDNLRVVGTDRAHRIVPSALDAAIGRDLDAGHVPVAVVASAGTVNTGAIDPLDEIADVCARHGVWLHVDGAYGAPAVLARARRSTYGAALEAMARADSVALDPHKWLYVPVEAGAVLVRDAAAMREAFSLVPPYLRTDGSPEGVGGLPWFSEYGFQQTRGFRALKVWMALKHRGTDGYGASIDHDIGLAERLASLVREAPDLELWEPQSLSIVCFRYVPAAPAGDAATLDALNLGLATAVQLGGRAFVSTTTLDGRLFLRACILNPRASADDIAFLVEHMREVGARLHAGNGAPG